VTPNSGTLTMLSAVKNAVSKKTEDLKKQNEKKRKAAEDMEVEQQAKKRKQEKDEAKKSWEMKKKDVDDKLKVVEEDIKAQNDTMKAALTGGGRIKDTRVKESCFGTIQTCQDTIQNKMEEQKALINILSKLMAKKPKK
jgi:hypothetical protein